MATCKDCVHYDLCRSCSRIQLGWHGNSVHYVENIEEICKDFKDRSRFLELPCKPRDMIYRICPIKKGEKCCNCLWEFCDCYDIGFQSNCRHHSIKAEKAGNVEWIMRRIPFFGEIYFLTREAAEQALKERENNA